MRVPFRCTILGFAVACGSNLPTGTPGGGAPTAGALVNVSMSEYAFSPAPLTIAAGTTVRWMNTGGRAHTTTSDAGLWDSGSVAAATGGGAYGASTPAGDYRFTFNAAGTYTYHCSFHEQLGMRGTIIVTD